MRKPSRLSSPVTKRTSGRGLTEAFHTGMDKLDRTVQHDEYDSFYMPLYSLLKSDTHSAPMLDTRMSRCFSDASQQESEAGNSTQLWLLCMSKCVAVQAAFTWVLIMPMHLRIPIQAAVHQHSWR